MNYQWNVVQMNAYPEVDGEIDVVFTVHWTLSGTDGTFTGSTLAHKEYQQMLQAHLHPMLTLPKSKY
jgi:hypothetical protein